MFAWFFASEEELDTHNILPIIRAKAYVEALDPEAAEEAAFEAWTSSLIILYVYDQPTTVRSLAFSD